MAFEMPEEGQKAPPGWSKVTGHVIFNLKMEATSHLDMLDKLLQ